MKFYIVALSIFLNDSLFAQWLDEKIFSDLFRKENTGIDLKLGQEEFPAPDSIGTNTGKDITIIENKSLLELLAERDKASVKIDINGQIFYATYVFDSNWDIWFSLKPENSWGAAWTEKELEGGVYYSYKDIKLIIRIIDGVINIQYSPYESIDLKKEDIFSSLYRNSYKITFGGIVTYAIFRNISPLTEEEGTVALRIGSDGLFYYSLTLDKNIENAPRWLLAINSVLYGMKINDDSLSFVSKPIQIKKTIFFDEKKINF